MLDQPATAGARPGQPAGLAPGSGAGASGDSGGLRTRLAVPVAIAGGLALAAAFPPVGAWPLAAAGPALLAVALWRRTLRGAALVGLAFGLAFFVPLLSWLVNVAWYAWAALAIAEAIVFAVLAVGQRLLLRLRAWPLAVAGWWVAAEAVRDRWPWAFPWGRLAMSQAEAPTARWAAIGGPALLTFLVALAGTALAWLLLGTAGAGARPPPAAGPASRRPGPWRGRLVPALAFVVAAGVALAGRALPAGQPAAGAHDRRGGGGAGQRPAFRDAAEAAPGDDRDAEPRRRHRPARGAGQGGLAGQARCRDLAGELHRHRSRPRSRTPTPRSPARSTRSAGRCWSARSCRIRSATPASSGCQAAARSRSTSSASSSRSGRSSRSAGCWTSSRSLPSLQPVNFTAGHSAVVFRIGKVRLGDVICYEVGFDNLVGSEVTAGANLLTMQTNDADFELDGQLGETLQQLGMARLRAIEYDRAVVVASTTGVSAIIAPDGSLIAHSGTWQRAVLDARVPLRSGLTLAARLGGWPEIVLTGLTVAALAWAVSAAGISARYGARHP